MTKYLLLGSGGSMPETEAEGAAMMAAWGVWYTGLGAALVDPGNPIAMVKGIASDGTVSDGSVGAIANGYIIIQADSLDAAVKMVQACPLLQGGGQISVYQTFEM